MNNNNRNNNAKLSTSIKLTRKHNDTKQYYTNKCRELNVFFWVIPRHPNFICRHFETLCVCVCVPKHWHIKFRRRGINPLAYYFLQHMAHLQILIFLGENGNFVQSYFIHAKLIFIDFNTYPCCAVMLGWSLNCLFKIFLWCDTP